MLRNSSFTQTGATPGLKMRDGQQAEPLKGVWGRSPQRDPGDLTDHLPPKKLTWSASVPGTTSGKSGLDISTPVNPVATTLDARRFSVVDWGVVCLLAAYCGSNCPLARAMGCHCLRGGRLLQSMPVSCHFRGYKAPLSRIVSGAISSELPLPLPFASADFWIAWKVL